MQNCLFAVCGEPYSVWGWDLSERNESFISRIDEEYFQYATELNAQHLDGPNAQRAAIALRNNYYMALETLFSLIGALIQAPDCVPAWILKATTVQVRQLVESLQSGEAKFPSKWCSGDWIDFDFVANLMMQHSSWARDSEDETAMHFSHLLSRLAHDFLDSNNNREYNSIKHGFRAHAGGFVLAIGLQDEQGRPASRERMKSLGGSRFGTSFYAAEPVKGAPALRRDHHLTLRRHALNWLPEVTADRTLLTVMAIKNVKSCLTVAGGTPANTVHFYRPEEPEQFMAPWNRAPGVTSFSFDRVVEEGDIHRMSRDEILRILNAEPPDDIAT